MLSHVFVCMFMDVEGLDMPAIILTTCFGGVRACD
jgi:hypothetical protein